MYNKRLELIRDFIKDNPASKREDIEIFLAKMGYDATKMTITRDLKLLLGNGDVEKSGLAKATIYNPSVRINLLNDKISAPILTKSKMNGFLAQSVLTLIFFQP